VEALGAQLVEPREVVVAQELQRVVEVLVQDRAVGLEARQALDLAACAARGRSARRDARQQVVGLVEALLQTAVEEAQLDELHRRQLEHAPLVRHLVAEEQRANQSTSTSSSGA
jgi:hypothetical protein